MTKGFLKLQDVRFFNFFVACAIWIGLAFIFLPKQAFVQSLYESWFVSKGLVFYKDFGGGYLPFLRMLMVLYHSVFGYNQTATIILSPVNSLVILWLLFAASKKILTGKTKYLPILFFIIWYGYLGQNHFVTTSFMGTTILLSTIFWLDWYEKPKLITAFLAGFFASISFLSLQMVGFYLIAIYLSILFRSIAKQGKKFVYTTIAMGMGFILPAGLIISYLIINNAFKDFYYWIVTYKANNYPFSNLGRGTQNIIIFSAVHSPILLVFLIMYDSIKRKKRETFKKYFSLLLILVSLPIVFWFSIFHPLRFEISLPTFALLLGICVEKVKKLNAKINTISVIVLSVIFLLNAYCLFFIVGPQYKSNFLYNRKIETIYDILDPSILEAKNILSKIYRNDPMYDAVIWVRKKTTTNATLIVLADPLFYVESRRVLANPRAFVSQPWVFEPLDDFAEELKQKPPDYWVVDERLIDERFPEFGYEHTKVFFDKLLSCEPVVAQFEYVTIRKHDSNRSLCLPDDLNDFNSL